MRGRAWRPIEATACLAVLLLAASTVAPPAAGHASPSRDWQPLLDDPEGDAHLMNTWSAQYRAAATACHAGGWIVATVAPGTACVGTLYNKDIVPFVPLVPAPADLDIRAAFARQTAAGLEFRLELREVVPGHSAWAAQDGSTMTVLGLCWEMPGAACGQGVRLVASRIGGTLNLAATYHTPVAHQPQQDGSWLAEDCRFAAWRAPCEAGIAFHVETGPGGGIVWRLPADLLGGPGAAGLLRNPRAIISHYYSPSAAAGLATETQAWWWATGSGAAYGTAATRTWAGVDSANATATFHWGPEAPRAIPDATRILDAPGDAHGGGEPDVLQVVLSDTPTELRLGIQYAEVRDPPVQDAETLVLVEVANETVLWFSDTRLNGTRDARVASSVVHPSVSLVTPGPRGWVNWTVQRGDIPLLRPGALLHATSAQSSLIARPSGIPGDGSGPGVAVAHLADFVPLPPPHRVRTSPAATSEAHVLPDRHGDAHAPALATPPMGPGAFDITAVDLAPMQDGSLRVRITIAELPSVHVPEPYAALLIGIGFRTADDRYVSAGHYREAGGTEGKDFCGADTWAFEDSPRRPDPYSLDSIDGSLHLGTPGWLELSIPPRCFGTVPGAATEIDRVVAATFVYLDQPSSGLPLPLADLEWLDAAVDERDITLGPPTGVAGGPADPSGSWLSALGTPLLLVAAALATAALLLGRRTMRARAAPPSHVAGTYREAVQALVAAGMDPGESAQLAQLRKRLGVTERDHAILLAVVRADAGKAMADVGPGALVLGKYRIDRQLGQGSHGRAFLAQDTVLRRPVVLKLLRPDRSCRDDIVREARAIAAVPHPNVVTLFDADAVGDDVFLVMEHVPAGSLQDRIAAAPLPLAEFARAAADLLAGLGAVHAAGVVHLDVKPANVLVSADGRYKLADFGVAVSQAVDSTLVASPESRGTLAYMSPEQAKGHAPTVRSDLYAAAATLFQALTGTSHVGRVPGETVPEMRMRIAAQRPWRGTVPGPAGLRAWFARALHPDPARRFPTAAAMQRGLDDALAGLRRR